MNINEVTILEGMERMNFEKITAMLSQAHWSPGIKIDEVKQGALNSALVIGAFYNTAQQIGYARVISDKTRFAYIADVYVDENFRKKGVALKMMRYILSHNSLKDVYQWLLRSAENEFYQKVNFVPVADPLKWLEIRNKRPNR